MCSCSFCVCVCVYLYLFMHLCRLQEPNRSGHSRLSNWLQERLGSPHTKMLQQLKLQPQRSKRVRAFLCPPGLGCQTSPLSTQPCLQSQFQWQAQLSSNYFKCCCIMLHCAMQTSLGNSGMSSSPPWDCSCKALRSLPTFWSKHSSQLQGEQPHKDRKEAQEKIPNKVYSVDNSTIPKKEAAAENHLLPTSLKIETLTQMMLRISAQLVCIPRKGHFSTFTGYWNIGRVQGNIIHNQNMSCKTDA